MSTNSPSPIVCPECREQGLTSSVVTGPASTSLIYAEPAFDEHGQPIGVDPNRISRRCTCSNGHSWTSVVPADRHR